MPLADPLADAWARFSAFVNGVGLDTDAGAAAAHERLARFNPSRPQAPAHVRLSAYLLAQGVALLQASLSWERPAAGPPRRGGDTTLARGEQWRLVMGYAGFELLVKALLDCSPGCQPSRDEFAALLSCCGVCDFRPLEPPTPAAAVRECWLPGGPNGDHPPALEYLNLDRYGARLFTDWLVRRTPISDWCSALCLARTMRDATAHGGLLAEMVQEWKLQHALDRLLADLAEVAAAALQRLAAEGSASLQRQSRRVPAAPSLTRPVPERIPGLEADSEEEALVRTIASAPEDDTPRLVYADWLEEHGRLEQAEFIRGQCELARAEEDGAFFSPRTEVLSHRCEAITPRREGPWRSPEGVGTSLVRGFPSLVRCRPADFVERGEQWLAAAPTLHALQLLDLGRSQRDARAVGAAEHLARFTRLWIDGRASGAAVADLLASPRLAGLTALALTSIALRSEGILALVNAHHLTRLTHLDLKYSAVGSAALLHLLGSPVVDRLTHLNLSGHHLRDAGVQALAGTLRLAQLSALNLQANQIRAEGALALAQSPRMERLRLLNLWGNRLGSEGLRALADSPYLGGLETLLVGVNRVGDAGIEALARSPRLSALTRLVLDQNDLSDGGVAALAASPYLGNLRSLSLSDSTIGEAGWRALVDSESLVNLRELWAGVSDSEASVRALAGCERLVGLDRLRLHLGRNGPALLGVAVRDRDGPPLDLEMIGEPLKAEAVAALAAGPGLKRVQRLRLLSDQLGNAGVRSIASSPRLGELTELELGNNGIGPEGAAALAGSARLAGLVRLDLTNNPLGNEGAKRLAGSPHLGRLAVLVLCQNGIGPSGALALANSPHLGNLRHLDLAANGVGAAGALALIRSPQLGRLARLDLASVVLEEAPQIRTEAARRGIVV